MKNDRVSIVRWDYKVEGSVSRYKVDCQNKVSDAIFQ